MAEGWDAKYQIVIFKGKEIQVFSRGALAKALNRQHTTIRRMIDKGIICHPRYQNRRSQWIYSRAQIEALIKLADEEGVLDPNYRRPFTQRFIDEAHEILKWKSLL
jgi:IS30 family transposase